MHSTPLDEKVDESGSTTASFSETCFSSLDSRVLLFTPLLLPPSLFTDSINPPFHPCRLVESFFLFFFSFSRKRVTLFEGISLITRLLRREWWNVSSLKQEWNESCYYDAWLISSIDREFGKNFHEIEISLNQRRIEILLKVDSKEESRSFLSNRISYYR